MSENFITVLYDLDKSDPDNIAKGYHIDAFPTIVILTPDGEELNRGVGVPSEADAFINRVKQLNDPENSWATMTKNLTKDTNSTMSYIVALHGRNAAEKADEMYKELFEKRSIEENFNEESVEYYQKFVREITHYTFDYMFEHEKEVIKLVGKETYAELCEAKARAYFSRYCFFPKSLEILNDKLDYALKSKYCQTPYYDFLREAGENLVNRSFSELCTIAVKHIKKASQGDHDEISRLITSHYINLKGENKEIATPIYENYLSISKEIRNEKSK